MLFMETDELQEYLNALGRSDNYRVDAVLSDAPHERTERVFYVGNNGSELGPFIRKTIATDSGQGRTYEKIFRAQHEGKRFVHMPRIFECYVADSSLVVLLEYVEGETLQDYVRERGASYELALRIFPPICDAASELHKAFDPPLIHRDLTPANIVVSPGGITIIDLSIARTFQPDATKDTTYFGTRAYAPPEQFGFGQTDVRSDVYTLGKVLAFCAGANDDEATTAPDPGIARVVRKATELDPEKRFQSVEALKAAFLSALASARPAEQPPNIASKLATRSASEAPLAPQLAARPILQPAFQPVSQPAPQPISQPVSQLALQPGAAPVSASQQQAGFQQQAGVQTANQALASQTIPTAQRKPTNPKGLFSRIPLGVGVAWDVILLLVWLLFFAASNAVIVSPTGEVAQHPLWFLIVEYYGVIVLPITVLVCYLLDLRPLRKLFPKAKFLPRRKTWPFAILTVFVLIVATIAIGTLSGVVAPPS